MPNKEQYEKNKEYYKEYRENNKELRREYDKERYENNKEYFKEYHQTEKGQMVCKIAIWIHRGVIYPNMKELYYTYKMTTHCHYCWCLLVEGNFGANRKCLDHNHETGEPRGVICNTCNSRDVFKNC